MQAAVIQLSSQDDVFKNLARAVLLIGEAARAGAQVVALPENFAYVGDEEGKRAIAERLDGKGPILSAIISAARASTRCMSSPAACPRRAKIRESLTTRRS